MKKMKNWALALGLICFLLLQGNYELNVSAASFDDSIAGGVVDEDYGQITWVIDANGKLTVNGTGDVVALYSVERDMPWEDNQQDIVSAEINVTGMKNAGHMFYGCSNLKEIDLSGFDTSSVTSMERMFYECSSLSSLDLSGFDTSNVTSMASMFCGCSSLSGLDLSEFDTSNVMFMSGMFSECSRLSVLDLSGFDTIRVTTMQSMFYGCSNLNSLDLSGFNTSSVETMYRMFAGCNSLTELDLSGFNANSVEYVDDVFKDCESLTLIETPKNVNTFLKEVVLPGTDTDKWYRPDGTAITSLPQGLAESITIAKNRIPVQTDHGNSGEDSYEEDTKKDVTTVFDDVYQTWYTNYVQYVYDHEIMNGIKGTKHFAPNSDITKAQVAQVLYNLEGQPTVTVNKVFQELNDVYEGQWYSSAVSWAYNEGIVTGDLYSKQFAPNASVTREQLALMLYRYAAYKGYDTTLMSDLAGLQNAEKVSDWAIFGMKWAVGTGLISGIENKDLAPQGNASRAQIAAILQRFCETY